MQPHDVSLAPPKQQPSAGKRKKPEEGTSSTSVSTLSANQHQHHPHHHHNNSTSVGVGRKHGTLVVQQLQPIPTKVRPADSIRETFHLIQHIDCVAHVSQTLNERRSRLETQLSRLMARLPVAGEDEQPVNLSYLLTGRGTRRRTNVNTIHHTNNVPV